MKKELSSAVAMLLAASMLCTSCGKRDINKPQEEQSNTESQQDQASNEISTAADAASEEATAEETAAEEPVLTDEDFYAEILDLHYYDLVDQHVYDDFYYPGSMVTYAYSKDGYDKAGALDYSGYGFEDLDGDGRNELIIGNLSDDPKLENMVFLVCTRHNNVPYGVLSSTESTNYYLCTGKLIGCEEHGGYEWYNKGCLYEFSSADIGTTFVVGVESSKGDNDSTIWKKVDVSGKEFEITSKEAESAMAEYRERRITPTLTAFSQYKPRQPEEYYDGVAYTTFGSGYKSWNEAYLAYYNERCTGEDSGGRSYALINVDDDDIPELVIDNGYEAAGCQILSYYDGTVRVLQTNRLYFTYIEKSGLLCNSEGHMGYYYDYVYKLDHGQWKSVFSGEYYDFDESVEIDYDEETGRYRTLHYVVDGEELDEKTYLARLDAVYDSKLAKAPDSYLLIDDLMSYLTTGKMYSDGHHYELIVEDCTWEEAQKKCEEKGGYLASMTCDEEFDRVDDLIRSEGKQDICFYIGANRIDSFSWKWTEPGLRQNECVGNGYWKHWLDGMPSYTGTLADGTEIQEEYVEYFYRKAEDKFLMNDIPNDVIGNYPSYAGRIGYICEYAN